ncbi:MAG: CPBP family intramembrane glutamic endopeptidase [Thiobacillaceae bacterium]
MSFLRRWFSQWPVTAYYLLYLLFSWGYWLAMLPNSTDTGPAARVSHPPDLLGPMVAAIIVLLLNGFGEEAGWRGFASTQLLPRLDKLRTTVVVAVLWLAWHAPLFWLNTAMHELLGPAFFGWLFGLICGAFVLAAVYLASGQSILVVAVWHTLYNMVVATCAGTGTPAAVASTAVMLWGIFIAVRWWRQQREVHDA